MFVHCRGNGGPTRELNESLCSHQHCSKPSLFGARTSHVFRKAEKLTLIWLSEKKIWKLADLKFLKIGIPLEFENQHIWNVWKSAYLKCPKFSTPQFKSVQVHVSQNIINILHVFQVIISHVSKISILNPYYTGGLFHCYVPFGILGVLGLFCHFYSFFNGKSCQQTV